MGTSLGKNDVIKSNETSREREKKMQLIRGNFMLKAKR
jgi:hypothetical protein